MASPHIAGLAAYLLGTEWAAKAAKEEALALQAEAKTSSSFASALGQIAFGSRRSFVGKPEDHLLSPKALKKHMIEIGTPKVLTVSRDTNRHCPATENAARVYLLLARTDGPVHLQDIGDGSPNILSFNDWSAPKKGDDDDESSVPSKEKKPEGKWRFEEAVASEEKMASALVEKLQNELEALRSEIRVEVEEVADLVRELAEDFAAAEQQ